MTNKLTKEEKKKLKAIAHNLKPFVIIGKEGLSKGVIESIDTALTANELIKVKLLESSMLDRKKDSKKIADSVDAEIVQIRGFIITLYRKNPNKKNHVL